MSFKLYSNYHHINYIGDSMIIPFVEFEWENVPLSDVSVVKIPDIVYDSIWSDSEWSEFLFWDKKNILFVYLDDCPYARAYNNQTENTFSENPLLNYSYSKNILKVAQSYVLECSSRYCPSMWLDRICGAKFCIINPNVKEIVVDSSQNPEQIPTFLDFYENYDDKMLLV